METTRKILQNHLEFKSLLKSFSDLFKQSQSFNKTKKLLEKINEFKRLSNIFMLTFLVIYDLKPTKSKTIDLFKNVTKTELEDDLDDKTTITKIKTGTDINLINLEKKDVNEAVLNGLNLMHELYNIKEPLLYKLGFYLDPNEPAAKLAEFKTPNIKANLQAKYGFATVQATLRLTQRFRKPRKLSVSQNDQIDPLQLPRNSLQRQSQDVFENFFEDFSNDILEDQCPFKPIPRCTLASKRYRTSDGSCNNPNYSNLGSSLSPLQRFLHPVYEDGVQSERRSILGSDLPSPRLISSNIHQERNIEAPALSLMLMQWGQFLDHDITSTVSSRAFNSSIPRCCLPGGVGFLPLEFTHPECMPISVPITDNFFSQFGIKCMEFIRSAPATRINCKLGYREQINQATSFIDASMIYGSDVQKSESLRTFKNGRLIFKNHNNCNFGAISSHCFSSGDKRFGEQPALTALHTIWVKFHNKIAEDLLEINPHWSDEKIYQESRRIIVALIQHITYREFLPIILGPEVIDLFELKLLRDGFYNGYDDKINPTTSNEFSTAAFRFGHSLVQKSFLRTTMNHRTIPDNVSLHEEMTNFHHNLFPGSLHRLILGLINQPSQRRDEFITGELTRHLFQSPGSFFGVDLASINIQRGRDHGIPPYTSWRVPCGLTPLEKWSDLFKVIPKETALKFRDLYEDIDDIDLYTGGLSEKPVRGGLIGPVFACIVAQQFLNYRKGDRFWYENGGFESSFTIEQLNQIRRVSLAEVICGVLKNVDTIQNFVFLLVDDDKNPRKSCEEIISNGINLEYWRDELEGIKFNIKGIDRFEINNQFDEFEDLDNFNNRLNLKFKRNLDVSKNSNSSINIHGRDIGEYIMETIEDYYDDSYDYEENVPKPIKKRRKNSKKPISKRKPVTIPPTNSPQSSQNVQNTIKEDLYQGDVTVETIPIKILTPPINESKINEEKLTFIPVKTLSSPKSNENNKSHLVQEGNTELNIKDKYEKNTNNKKNVFVIHELSNEENNQNENANYQVNVHINYLLGNKFEETTKKPISNPLGTNLNEENSHLDKKEPYIDNKRPYLNTDRLSLVKDRDQIYLQSDQYHLDKPQYDSDKYQYDLDKHKYDLEKHKDDLDKHKDDLDKHKDDLDKHKNDLGKHTDDLDKYNYDFDKHKYDLDKHKYDLDSHKDDEHKNDLLQKHKYDLDRHQHNVNKKDNIDKHYDDSNKNEYHLDKDQFDLNQNKPDLDNTRIYIDKIRPTTINSEVLNDHESYLNNDKLSSNEKLYLDNVRQHLNKYKPHFDSHRPHLDNHRPYLDSHRPYLDSSKPLLDNLRPHLDKNTQKIDTNKPHLGTNGHYSYQHRPLDDDEHNLDKDKYYLHNGLYLDKNKVYSNDVGISSDKNKPCLNDHGIYLENNRPHLNTDRLNLNKDKDESHLQLDKFKPHLDELDSHLDKHDPHLEKLNPHLDKLDFHIDKFKPHLDKVDPYLEKFDSRLEKLDSHLEKLNPHLDKLDPHLDKFDSHLDKSKPHLDKLSPLLDKLDFHLDKFNLHLSHDQSHLDKNPSYLDDDRSYIQLNNDQFNLYKHKLHLDKGKPILDNRRPYLDKSRPSLDSNKGNLNNDDDTYPTDRLYLDNHRLYNDKTRPNLERDRPFYKRTPNLDKSNPCLDNDRIFLSDRPHLDNDNIYLDKNRFYLDKDRVYTDMDSVYLDHDRVYLSTKPCSNGYKPYLENTSFQTNKKHHSINSTPHLINKTLLNSNLFVVTSNSYLINNDLKSSILTNKRPDLQLDKDKTSNLKPLVSITLYQNQVEQTTKKSQNYPIYILNTIPTTLKPITLKRTTLKQTTLKPTTSKSNSYVTGYQIKKTTTKEFYDVPVFIGSNKNKVTTKKYPFTTKTYVQDVGYDPINEDITTTKRPFGTNFQNFPTDRPQFTNLKPLSKPNVYNLYNSQEIAYNNKYKPKPVYVNDPIDDVYTTILQKPHSGELVQFNNKHKIDNKLDFKSELLPNKLKTKNTNLIKIYSVKSRENERSEDEEDNLNEKVLLPELDGVEVVHIEVYPSETKFLSNNTKGKGNVLSMPNVTNFMENSNELPKPMKLKVIGERRSG